MRDTLIPVRCKRLFGVDNVNRLRGEQRLYLFHDLTWRRIPKAIRVNNFPVINIDTELAKTAPYRFYLYVIFFSQLCCHTGSHHLFDGSNRAVMDCDSLHSFILPFGSEPTTPYKYFGLIE